MSKLLLVRLLVFAVCLALSRPATAASTLQPETLTIFVKGGSDNMDAVRTEVARLMEPAGFVVEWKAISERRAGVDFSRLVSVELRGSCSANLASAPVGSIPSIHSLASTSVVDGRVLPFSTVECDALRKVLAPALSGAKPVVRSELFGRAIARVLAHELYHTLAQTKGHGSTGVSKSCFGLADLTAERFEFDAVTLAQMRPFEEEPLVEFEESGR